MDWTGAIDRNRDDLLAVVARLFTLAGIRSGRSVIMMPRYLRVRVLAALRPAEFAARRLIAIAACKLVSDSGLPLSNKKTDSGLPLSNQKADRGTPENHLQGRSSPRKDGTKYAFPLFDPLKPYRYPWLEDGETDDDADPPRDSGLRPDDPVDARKLCRRILALEQAMQDLETHAKRLARWRARRAGLWASSGERARVRLGRFGPIRPGRPPGWSKHPKTPVATVLKECDALARDAWNTS